jgi:hypothetical protein
VNSMAPSHFIPVNNTMTSPQVIATSLMGSTRTLKPPKFESCNALYEIRKGGARRIEITMHSRGCRSYVISSQSVRMADGGHVTPKVEWDCAPFCVTRYRTVRTIWRSPLQMYYAFVMGWEIGTITRPHGHYLEHPIVAKIHLHCYLYPLCILIWLLIIIDPTIAITHAYLSIFIIEVTLILLRYPS